MRRLPTLASALTTATVIVAGGCGGDPVAPHDGASPPAEVPLSLSSEDKAGLRDALLFAGQETVRGLRVDGMAGRVVTAFTTLAGRIDANDRAGTERAMAAARLAISRYRDQAGDAGAAADLEAMELTLLRTAALVSEVSTPEHSLTTTDKERP